MSRTFILNLLFIINYMCRSALRFYTPSRCVTHLNDGYIYSQRWRAFHSLSSPTHLLLWLDTSIWEVVLKWEKGRSCWNWKKDEISAVRVSRKVWWALTLVNAWSELAEIWWRVRFLKGVLIGTKIKVKRLTEDWAALTLLLLPCVEFFG